MKHLGWMIVIDATLPNDEDVIYYFPNQTTANQAAAYARELHQRVCGPYQIPDDTTTYREWMHDAYCTLFQNDNTCNCYTTRTDHVPSDTDVPPTTEQPR